MRLHVSFVVLALFGATCLTISVVVGDALSRRWHWLWGPNQLVLITSLSTIPKLQTKCRMSKTVVKNGHDFGQIALAAVKICNKAVKTDCGKWIVASELAGDIKSVMEVDVCTTKKLNTILSRYSGGVMLSYDSVSSTGIYQHKLSDNKEWQTCLYNFLLLSIYTRH